MIPIGVSDFRKLVTAKDSGGKGYLFVDKTMMIKAFIDIGTEVTLITRPRRFGKTLNLSMLEYFFSHEVGGKPTKGLFDGMAIAQHRDIMAKQGQYPTIFLTLKGIKGNNYKESIAGFSYVVSELFKKHRYLLKTLPDSDKRELERLINKKASFEELKNALKFLSQCLYDHTGKKVVILIDEYDSPLHCAYLKGYYEDLKNFMKTFLGEVLKDNNTLYHAMITGILKVAKASLFSDLNNLKVCSMLSSSHYADAFGFTEKETEALLKETGLAYKGDQLKDIKQMYNGYQVEGITLYNPFSIISFIDSALAHPQRELRASLKPYWVNTGGTHLIGDMLTTSLREVEEDMRKLIQKQPVQVDINEEIVLEERMMKGATAFWSMMLLAGYVQSTGTSKTPQGQTKHHLSFPNEEVGESMRQLFLRSTTPTNTSAQLPHGMEALLAGDVTPFVELLEDFLTYVTSHHDGRGRYKEQFYHGLVLGMTAFFLNTHHIRSNRESGKGRYDIALEPKVAGQKGIILEIKAIDEAKDLKVTAAEARQQIEEGHYKADMVSRGVKDFILLGIAFSGKDVVVSE